MVVSPIPLTSESATLNVVVIENLNAHAISGSGGRIRLFRLLHKSVESTIEILNTNVVQGGVKAVLSNVLLRQ